jgi:hypothetical protein
MPARPELTARLRSAAKIVADDARLRSARWSRRVPLSVRLQGGASSVTIVAGGQAAPQAYTMEGAKSGAPLSHPVHAHGPRESWTWVKQPPRPFLREAIDAKQDQMLAEFAKVADDWARQKGFR